MMDGGMIDTGISANVRIRIGLGGFKRVVLLFFPSSSNTLH